MNGSIASCPRTTCSSAALSFFIGMWGLPQYQGSGGVIVCQPARNGTGFAQPAK
ncbi:MAG: hypothetical protein V4625_01095 [Pseudomonadota bacterium]